MQASARSKRERKKLSMVAGNVVGPEHAFGRDDNALFVVWDGGERELAKASKHELADQLVALIAERMAAEVGLLPDSPEGML
jgi:phosphopantothenoylcysteine decarboxylase/phosphopantothenate--cysteine ligase